MSSHVLTFLTWCTNGLRRGRSLARNWQRGFCHRLYEVAKLVDPIFMFVEEGEKAFIRSRRTFRHSQGEGDGNTYGRLVNTNLPTLVVVVLSLLLT